MKKQKKRDEGGVAMESKKIMEFRNIVKNFDGQMVLKGVNLDIYEHELESIWTYTNMNL